MGDSGTIWENNEYINLTNVDIGYIVAICMDR